jgi:hypothetical protein
MTFVADVSHAPAHWGGGDEQAYAQRNAAQMAALLAELD